MKDVMRVQIPCLPLTVLGVCWIRTRPCEGRRPGSIPGKGTVVKPLLMFGNRVSTRLTNQSVDDFRVISGTNQPLIQSLKRETELVWIESKQVQYGRL